MPDTQIPIDKSVVIIQAILRKKGGMAAFMIPQVPSILKDLESMGVKAFVADVDLLKEKLNEK